MDDLSPRSCGVRRASRLIAWSLMIGAPAASIVMGLLRGQAAGGAFVGLLAATFLAAGFAGVNAIVRIERDRAVQLAWLGTSVAILLFTIWLFHLSEDQERDVVLVYTMLVLSFPSGFLAIAVYLIAERLQQRCCPAIAEAQALWTGLFWLATTGLGYLQWFVVLPALARRVRRALVE